MSESIETEGRAGARRRVARWAARVEKLLWAVGGVTLAVVIWMVSDAVWYQHRAGAQLAERWRNGTSLPAVGEAPASEAPVIPAGTPLARLVMPRLDVSAIVAEGVDDGVLRRALGHIPGSALPGESGNVALAGHRDTFFRSLGELHRGDLLRLESASGRDTYQVEWAAVVEPSQVAVAKDAGYPALTLVTCYPFHYIGDAPYRYVLRARRVLAASVGSRAAG